jgi:hypothetical protein
MQLGMDHDLLGTPGEIIILLDIITMTCCWYLSQRRQYMSGWEFAEKYCKISDRSQYRAIASDLYVQVGPFGHSPGTDVCPSPTESEYRSTPYLGKATPPFYDLA